MSYDPAVDANNHFCDLEREKRSYYITTIEFKREEKEMLEDLLESMCLVKENIELTNSRIQDVVTEKTDSLEKIDIYDMIVVCESNIATIEDKINQIYDIIDGSLMQVNETIEEMESYLNE